jgi:hypothetical protein
MIGKLLAAILALPTCVAAILPMARIILQPGRWRGCLASWAALTTSPQQQQQTALSQFEIFW